MGTDGVGPCDSHSEGWEPLEGSERGSDRSNIRHRFPRSLAGCWGESRRERVGLKGSSKMPPEQRGLEGEKWWDLWHILKAELVGLADRLDVGCIRKKGVKMTPSFWARGTGRMGFPLRAGGKILEKSNLKGKSKS